jgi:hypothetical protein
MIALFEKPYTDLMHAIADTAHAVDSSFDTPAVAAAAGNVCSAALGVRFERDWAHVL